MTNPAALPVLRDEIIVYPGPTGSAGQPSWVLHDPARNQFFRLDWPTYEILSRWDYGSPAFIVEAVNRETTLEITLEDIEGVAEFLDTHCLIKRPGVADAMELARRKQAGKKAWWLTLMHRYLFFRVPLVNPDRWLERWLFIGHFLFSRGFTLATGAVLLFALVKVSQQWDVFQSTLLDTFTLKGFMTYALALVGVKILHELGHGFMAKRYGCRVPVMGVAFLVLFPMAYTDTNEVWKISDRRKRLAISTAGLRLELLVAAWATLLWAILPDGAIRSAVFFLASVSWVLSVLLNISPFMRFDGYFVLMDWLDFPNLHARSSALARWRIRRLLFGLDEPPPEVVSPGFQRFLVAFAIFTWVYRFFLFIGIALLVYYVFTKILGILLFVVEIYWFILAPVIKEAKLWWERRAEIWAQRRTRITAVVAAGFLLVFVVPLPNPVSSQALMRPAQFTEIAVPEAAMVKALAVGDGAEVASGSPLVELASPSLLLNRQMAAQRAETATWRYQAANLAQARVGSPRLAAEQRQSALAELERANREVGKLSFVAPHQGTFRLNNPDIGQGEWLSKDTVIGTLVDADRGLEVLTWIDESAVDRLAVGANATYFSQSYGGVVSGRVVEIEGDATDALPFPSMASVFGGEILVREKDGELIPERAVYRVVVEPDDMEVNRAIGVHYGELMIDARPASLGGRYLRKTLSILLREIAP
ncbi:MAG: secretion protein HylD [Spiribacter salinus]|uniref:Secretion protein HylD n=1 Tax=Spiribacter salinus TaxID=1335746 RepID=A0A540VSV0_9GAMM|nr:MAG: secretion protein HylD [Spiribacter salinus]